MYQTARQYLYGLPLPSSKLTYINTYSPIEVPEKTVTQTPPVSKPQPQKQLTLNYKTRQVTNTADPTVWGPAYWFTLHNSAKHYPEKPSPIVRERIKGRILAIPYEIPCPSCKSHALAFIEKHKDRLEDIVSSRQNLFNFYVDFHNQVNARHNKPIISYQEAWNLYANGMSINYLNY